MRDPQKRRTPTRAGQGFDKGFGNGTARAPGCNHTTPPGDLLLGRLDQVRQTGPDQWLARCPAHDDRSPSLSIKQADDRVLVHCFAGCEPGDVLAVVGLTLADLFDRPLAHHKAPLSAYQRRRHGQAAEALKALAHEINVVWVCAEQMHAGFALDPAERFRLKQAMKRLETARRLAA